MHLGIKSHPFFITERNANKYLKDVSISVEKDYANLDRFIFITNIKE